MRRRNKNNNDNTFYIRNNRTIALSEFPKNAHFSPVFSKNTTDNIRKGDSTDISEKSRLFFRVGLFRVQVYLELVFFWPNIVVVISSIEDISIVFYDQEDIML